MMASDLSNLKITEVSFCKRGMNQHAKISLFKSADKTQDSPAKPNSEHQEKPVSDLEKKVEELTKALETAQAEASVAKAVAGLTDVEKSHYEGLDEKAKTDFLAKSADERKTIVEKVTKSDESVELAGRTIRKSVVGEDTFHVLKAQAEDIRKANEEVKKARDAAEMADLRKRADDEFGKVVGSTDERAGLLKALKSVGGDVEAFGLKVLKSANESAAFTTIGKSHTETADVKKKFDDKVTEIAKRDNIPTHQAMAKAAVEFPELVNQE